MRGIFTNILGDSISEFVLNLSEDMPYFLEIKSYLCHVTRNLFLFQQINIIFIKDLLLISINVFTMNHKGETDNMYFLNYSLTFYTWPFSTVVRSGFHRVH
jgi:hypothetical protein